MFDDCHKVELIDPDPLLVVRSYARPIDQELVGLFCAVLAVGRAQSIVDACRRCLAPFGREPAAAIAAFGPSRTRALLGIDVYRFFRRRDIAALLSAIVDIQRRFGSLGEAFRSFDGTIREAFYRTYYDGVGAASARLLSRCDGFVDLVLGASRRLAVEADAVDSSMSAPLARNLLPAPRDGSACKRLMLFLRWMVRRDEVDLGLWPGIAPKELVIPLDTHVHRIAMSLGLTRRGSADLRAALETTEALRFFSSDDPVRFDFSLSRLGIRSDYSLKNYFPT